MSAQELKEKLATLMGDIESVRKENSAQAKDDERTAWLPEQADKFESLVNQSLTLERQIKAEEALEIAQEGAQRSAGLTIAPRADENPMYAARNSIEALHNWLYTGYWDGQYTERIQFDTPDLIQDEEKRNQSQRALATTGEGAHVIPGEIIAPLVKKLYEGDVVRAAGARVISTPTGNDYSVPRLGRGSTAVPIVAEAADSANLDPDLSDVVMKAYVYRAHNDFSREFEQDHGANLLAEMPAFWGESLSAARSTHHINGTNSSQPQGIMTAGNTNNRVSLAVADVADALSVDNVYDMLGKIKSPYWNSGLALFMHPETYVKFAQGADASDIVAFNPNLQTAIPARVLGYPIYISSDISKKVAGSAGNDFAVLYNMNYYAIRDVRGVVITRDTSIVAQKNQIRMYFQTRGDAKIINGDGTYAYAFQSHA